MWQEKTFINVKLISEGKIKKKKKDMRQKTKCKMTKINQLYQ